MNVDLARIQFASTSIYHFLFVPVTIGLGFLVAVLQTMWYRSRRSRAQRLTKFFGTLLVINVAIGVVTGLVQEFQFGMNWSELLAVRRRRVRRSARDGGPRRVLPRVDVPRPLAVRLGSAAAAHPPRERSGSSPSAESCRRRSSWRPTRGCSIPVGYEIDPDTNRPVLNDIGRGVHEPGVRVGLPARAARIARHRIARHARRVGVAPPSRQRSRAVPAHREGRARRAGARDPAEPDRGQQARRHRDDVPTDEDRRRRSAVDHVRSPARSRRSRSAAATTTRPRRRSSQIPHLLSVLATGTWDGEVVGLNELQDAVRAAVRTGQLRPERLHPVLVDARDGLPRCAGLPVLAVGRVAHLSRQAARRRSGSCSPRPGRSSRRS